MRFGQRLCLIRRRECLIRQMIRLSFGSVLFVFHSSRTNSASLKACVKYMLSALPVSLLIGEFINAGYQSGQ